MLCFPPATTDFSLATVSLTNVVGVRQIRDKNIQIAVINSKGTLTSPSPNQNPKSKHLDNLGTATCKRLCKQLALAVHCIDIARQSQMLAWLRLCHIECEVWLLFSDSPQGICSTFHTSNAIYP